LSNPPRGSRVGLAQEATPEEASAVLPPDAEVDGLDLGEWSARSWQWFFSLPQDVNWHRSCNHSISERWPISLI
jgi:hypothetical protein